MTKSGQKQPIFLHALFRTGSTYLYQAFRRLGTDYTCFQEPVHEISAQAKHNSHLLNDAQDSAKAESLRHPELNLPYFFELHEMAEQVLPHLQEEDVYDGYFGGSESCKGLSYWKALIENATSQPVIQECRSAGRIQAMQNNLGGFHAYLWRNPWDQWWSYQVSSYFDLTTQLIFNADPHPALIDKVSEQIGFVPRQGESLEVAFDWFANRPMTPDNAYLAFYTLWLLGLEEAIEHADLLVNIDQLSSEPDVQAQTVKEFAAQGVCGLDLSDCKSPTTVFSQSEEEHFRALEAKVHQWWLEAGKPEDMLARIETMRQRAAPQRREVVGQSGSSVDLARYRDLIKRQKIELIGLHERSDTNLQAAHRREDTLRQRIHDLSQLAERSEEQIREVKREFAVTESNHSELLCSHQALLSQHQVLLNSRSWRITAPLRAGATVFRQVRRGDRETFKLATKHRIKLRAQAFDHYSRRYPKLRGFMLAILHRVPWLAKRLYRIRHTPSTPQCTNQETLTPRSHDIYRQLVAAVDSLQNNDSQQK